MFFESHWSLSLSSYSHSHCFIRSYSYWWSLKLSPSICCLAPVWFRNPLAGWAFSEPDNWCLDEDCAALGVSEQHKIFEVEAYHARPSQLRGGHKKFISSFLKQSFFEVSLGRRSYKIELFVFYKNSVLSLHDSMPFHPPWLGMVNSTYLWWWLIRGRRSWDSRSAGTARWMHTMLTAVQQISVGVGDKPTIHAGVWMSFVCCSKQAVAENPPLQMTYIHIQILDAHTIIYIWGFPEMGVPPNHPFLDRIFP